LLRILIDDTSAQLPTTTHINLRWQPQRRKVHLNPATLPKQVMTDDELVESVRMGSDEAFEILVQRYQRFVLGLAARFLGNTATARDVAQDVFFAFWSDRRSYRPQGALRSYLASMTLNRCRNLFRYERVRAEKSQEVERFASVAPGSAPDPIRHLLGSEQSQRVRARLGQLPEPMREALLLRFAMDMPLEEIASAMRIPLGTVKSHLSRGLKRLHVLCAKDGLCGV
jgi:RNA polymerase sigma-70 factor, ECF subfamily